MLLKHSCHGSNPALQLLQKAILEEDGIQFLQGVHTQEIKDGQNSLTVVTDKGDFEFDILLYATGRKPNTAGLGLENTDIQVTDRGAIQVNRHLETSVPGVFAVGGCQWWSSVHLYVPR